MNITTHNHISKIVILVAIASTLLICTFLLTTKAYAAEINPAPGTYSYGSTSEFSPYNTLGQGTPTPNTLAPTGQSQAVGFVAITVLLAGATAIVWRLRSSSRKSNSL